MSPEQRFGSGHRHHLLSHFRHIVSCFCWFRTSQQLCAPVLIEPVALAHNIQSRGMMQQAVEDGRRRETQMRTKKERRSAPQITFKVSSCAVEQRKSLDLLHLETELLGKRHQHAVEQSVADADFCGQRAGSREHPQRGWADLSPHLL